MEVIQVYVWEGRYFLQPPEGSAVPYELRLADGVQCGRLDLLGRPLLFHPDHTYGQLIPRAVQLGWAELVPAEPER